MVATQTIMGEKCCQLCYRLRCCFGNKQECPLKVFYLSLWSKIVQLALCLFCSVKRPLLRHSLDEEPAKKCTTMVLLEVKVSSTLKLKRVSSPGVNFILFLSPDETSRQSLHSWDYECLQKMSQESTSIRHNCRLGLTH